MQTVITYITLFFTGLVLQAQVNTIELTITNLDSNDGTVLAGLYDSESNWLNKRLMGSISKIENKKATVVFTDVPDGTYAVSTFHDEDNDGKLNMIMGFYPSEDTASSNNAPARFGPPTWEDAKFEVKNGKVVKQSISM
ncbi:hypothetical protein ULMS_14110 [Patiriisocius marinistellae]|uniref:DUF2141 domain-containing protein n=1 Tax=Patiriisocius marinistellae TaxID=2494560 RepID=A0A5J4FVG8_9FLAO|nr:DUF2141 domain-containing protein [Patiriisocius marinistellae]GEQ85903.1 hypothetical protein ULMS_14110 [Patiriisocius marinistellae]